MYEAAEKLRRTTTGDGPLEASVARAAGRIAEALAGTRSRDTPRRAYPLRAGHRPRHLSGDPVSAVALPDGPHTGKASVPPVDRWMR